MSTETTIIYHLGVPHMDMDVLTWSLRKDNELLNTHGALARRPSLYREIIHERLLELEIEGADAGSNDDFLERVATKSEPKRLLLSDGGFLSSVEKTLSNGRLYANAGQVTASLRNLFAENPCEFFLEIRDPATLVPSLMDLVGEDRPEKFMNGADHTDLIWSEVVQDITNGSPDCKVTVWRYEDRAVVWPRVLHAVSGIPETMPMQGYLDQAERCLSEPALARLTKFLGDRPTLTQPQKTHVVASFVKADIGNRVEEFEDDPIWSDETVTEISRDYATDIERLREMDQVTFIS